MPPAVGGCIDLRAGARHTRDAWPLAWPTQAAASSLPSLRFICVADGAVTETLEVGDLSTTRIVGYVRPGDAVDGQTVSQTAMGQWRVRTAIGWVSTTSRYGSVILQPLAGEQLAKDAGHTDRIHSFRQQARPKPLPPGVLPLGAGPAVSGRQLDSDSESDSAASPRRHGRTPGGEPDAPLQPEAESVPAESDPAPAAEEAELQLHGQWYSFEIDGLLLVWFNPAIATQQRKSIDLALRGLRVEGKNEMVVLRRSDGKRMRMRAASAQIAVSWRRHLYEAVVSASGDQHPPSPGSDADTIIVDDQAASETDTVPMEEPEPHPETEPEPQPELEPEPELDPQVAKLQLQLKRPAVPPTWTVKSRLDMEQQARQAAREEEEILKRRLDRRREGATQDPIAVLGNGIGGHFAIRSRERAAFAEEMEAFEAALERMEKGETDRKEHEQARKEVQDSILEQTVHERLRAQEVEWAAQMADEKRLRQQAQREVEHARERMAAAALREQQEEMIRQRQTIESQKRALAAEEQRALEEIARREHRVKEWVRITKSDAERHVKQLTERAERAEMDAQQQAQDAEQRSKEAARQLMEKATYKADTLTEEAARAAAILSEQSKREREDALRRHTAEEEAMRREKEELKLKYGHIHDAIARKVHARRKRDAIAQWIDSVAELRFEKVTLRRFKRVQAYKRTLRLFYTWRNAVGQRLAGVDDKANPEASEAQKELTELLKRFKIDNLGPTICEELGVLSTANCNINANFSPKLIIN